jgi:hypothetical protein
MLDEDQAFAKGISRVLGHPVGSHEIPSTHGATTLDELVLRCNGQLIHLPRLEPVHLECTLEELQSEWPTISAGVLPRWQIADIPVMFAAGVAGAWSSSALMKDFGDLHDKTFARQHAGEIIDRVPGEGVGGFFHRLKHGHDLFSPFEVDWSNYAQHKGISGLTASLWPWIRHLLQDTFSREGLPIPGSSMLRSFIVGHVSFDTYRELMTVKARDLVGAALTTGIMEGYVALSSLAAGQKPCLSSYRRYSLVAGAHLVSVGAGLLMPSPSLNYGSAVQAAYYGFKLLSLIREVDRILAKRDDALRERAAVLVGNSKGICTMDHLLAEHRTALDEFSRFIDEALATTGEDVDFYGTMLASVAKPGDDDSRFLTIVDHVMRDRSGCSARIEGG